MVLSANADSVGSFVNSLLRDHTFSQGSVLFCSQAV